MTIMQLVSGVGTIAGILNVVLGVRNKDKLSILLGIAFTIVEATYLVGTIGW